MKEIKIERLRLSGGESEGVCESVTYGVNQSWVAQVKTSLCMLEGTVAAANQRLVHVKHQSILKLRSSAHLQQNSESLKKSDFTLEKNRRSTKLSPIFGKKTYFSALRWQNRIRKCLFVKITNHCVVGNVPDLANTVSTKSLKVSKLHAKIKDRD